MSNSFSETTHRMRYTSSMTEAAPWGPDRYLAGKAWDDRYPVSVRVSTLKTTARSLVNRLLKAGKLARGACTCGSADTEAHHEDYTKPLSVTWLCTMCHGARHRELRSRKSKLGMKIEA